MVMPGVDRGCDPSAGDFGCESHTFGTVRGVSDEGGPALFRLVRFWSRRWTRSVAVDIEGDASTPQHVLVVDAVAALQRGAAGVAVGELAQQLGLDHSGASRMAAAAVDAGYLRRRRAEADARRSALELTPAGHELLAAAHEWQRARFAELTRDWAARDRTRFAAYLDRLAQEIGA
jgi:DNA-binding MarR family transcriptional regulator